MPYSGKLVYVTNSRPTSEQGAFPINCTRSFTVFCVQRMGKRRFALISTSDEDEEALPRQQFPNSAELQPRRRRLKRIRLAEEEEEQQQQQKKEKKKKSEKKEREVTKSDEEEEELPQDDAKPIGEPVRFSGKGKNRRSHYEAFEFDGNRYDLVSLSLYFG